MLPLLFPGILEFAKSYFKVIIFSFLAVSLISFVSYHYVTITWYERQFSQLKSQIETMKLELDNYKLKVKFSTESTNQLKIYYENEIQNCKSQLKREGELQYEEIFSRRKK